MLEQDNKLTMAYMIDLHKDYIEKCYRLQSAANGEINNQLKAAYIMDTGKTKTLGCARCFLNTVIPAYIRMIKKDL